MFRRRHKNVESAVGNRSSSGNNVQTPNANGWTRGNGVREIQPRVTDRLIYLRPFCCCCDLMTFFTILASSTKNARRMLLGGGGGGGGGGWWGGGGQV